MLANPMYRNRWSGCHCITRNYCNMYFLLFYKTVDNYIERRAPFRAEHLKMAQAAADDGQLIMGGALADPADGAVLVFRADGPQVAEAFAKNDPYVQNGLISEWSVRPWTVVIGGEV